jgi:hypothetical protein
VDESVPVPLTELRSSFAVVCSSDARIALAEVVVTIRPPRFSLQAPPLSVAVDLNDAGDVLGYGSDDHDDPAVWTPTGVLRIDAPSGASNQPPARLEPLPSGRWPGMFGLPTRCPAARR